MRTRVKVSFCILPSLALCVAVSGIGLGAQGIGRELRRLPDGRPDLQGTYDISTVTPLERSPGQLLALNADEASKVEQQVLSLVTLANRPSSPTRTAPPVGGDGSVGNSGNVGGYNVYWIGGLPWRVTTLDGQPRSSLIIDPADGRLPTPTMPARVSAPSDLADDPENRTLAERCLRVAATSGTPILPYLYNNLHQIVQTADYVVIHSEMVHDARIIRIGGRHRPFVTATWLGDSVARWEGDTLVVDTINFRPNNGFLDSGDALHVVERFSRLDDSTLRYQFTVRDPQTWTRPWTVEYAWPAAGGRILEYACHENNYALVGILRGARFVEGEPQ